MSVFMVQKTSETTLHYRTLCSVFCWFAAGVIQHQPLLPSWGTELPSVLHAAGHTFPPALALMLFLYHREKEEIGYNGNSQWAHEWILLKVLKRWLFGLQTGEGTFCELPGGCSIKLIRNRRMGSYTLQKCHYPISSSGRLWGTSLDCVSSCCQRSALWEWLTFYTVLLYWRSYIMMLQSLIMAKE